MSHRVRIQPRAVKQIQSWSLPDRIQVEVFLFLTQVLPADLENNLSREASPFDGMICSFSRRDHHTRGREHEFVFHVFFSQDEEALVIDRGAYQREDSD